MKARIQLLNVTTSSVTLLRRDNRMYAINDPERDAPAHYDDAYCEIFVVKPLKKLTEGMLYLGLEPKTKTYIIDKLDFVTSDVNNDKHYLHGVGGTISDYDTAEEILASTYPSIGVPSVHECFVDAYIRNYNLGTKITDVWVVEQVLDSEIIPLVLTNNTILIKRYVPDYNSESEYITEYTSEGIPEPEAKIDSAAGKMRLLNEILKSSDDSCDDEPLEISSLIDAYRTLLDELDRYMETKKQVDPAISKITYEETPNSRKLVIEVNIPDDMSEIELLNDVSMGELIKDFIG